MNKEDLLALWKGINWEKHDSGIYFLGRYLNKDINIYFTGYCEQDLVLLSDDLMTSLYRSLEHLDKKAQKVIPVSYTHLTVWFSLFFLLM